jgi:hypothetical protein
MAPPGLALIACRACLLFSDPDCSIFSGNRDLHVGLCLASSSGASVLGVRCAFLAVLPYGPSERGLMFWRPWALDRPRPPVLLCLDGLPCWVSRRIIALAAAPLTRLTGMFVFMEVALAVFILPSSGLYRPPVPGAWLRPGSRRLDVVSVPSLEAIRGFADIRPQLLLQSLRTRAG